MARPGYAVRTAKNKPAINCRKGSETKEAPIVSFGVLILEPRKASVAYLGGEANGAGSVIDFCYYLARATTYRVYGALARSGRSCNAPRTYTALAGILIINDKKIGG